MSTVEARPIGKENAGGLVSCDLSESSVIALLRLVLADFGRSEVNYCYWKSSRRLPAVLKGEADLDLLVDRADLQRAKVLLLDRNFKLVSSVSSREHPATLSLVGYDAPSGRLIHMHLHFRLVIGEPLLKNYQLPWEDTILRRAIVHARLPVRMLDPTSEALLLVVRGCLELRSLDPVAFRNRDLTKQKFALDRSELAVGVERVALRDLASELLGKHLAEMVVNAVFCERASVSQTPLRRAMKKQLAAYRTYNALEARMRSLGRGILLGAGGMNKRLGRLPRPFNRRPVGGGKVVAVLGVDGSGKTTVVRELQAWLGSELDVLAMYFGTGDGRPSLVLRPFKFLIPLISTAVKAKPKGASHGKVGNHAPGATYKVMLMIWATAVALEKRGKLIAARRGANRGLIVLTDRYPQDEIVGFNDGPLLTRLPNAPLRLRRFEAAVYGLASRLRPDLVIKLVVTPETAATREPEMNLGVIRERVAAIPRLKFSGARVVTVDAEQPLAAVLGAVKDELWRLV